MTWHPDMPMEYRNQIVTGDARLLAPAIPDESIDLIFTDPIYQNIDDYRWLAETAARVLKLDRACLVWCGIGYLPETLQALNHGKLSYKWILPDLRPTGTQSRFCGPRLFSNWRCLLWMEKGTRWPSQTISDVSYANEGRYKGLVLWGKALKTTYHRTNAFTRPDDIVFDPFCGGGTVPAVCKVLGRNYIAFEILPDVAEQARRRVANTQPPLFVMQPEQVELWDEQG